MSSKQHIFRQVALERLSTPEQLDQAMRVTAPLERLVLIALAVLLSIGLGWSFVTTVPVRVSAQGILLGSGGVLTVAADARGRITRLQVRPGDTVSVGQELAWLDLPDLRQERDAAKADLAELERRKTEIVSYQSNDSRVQQSLLRDKRRELEDTLGRTEERMRLLEERERNIFQLLDKQIISTQTHLNAKIDLDAAREAASRTRADLKQVERDETALTTASGRERLDLDMSIGAARRRVDSLDERLERQSAVLSPYSGEVAELKVNIGELVDKSTEVLSLIPVDAGRGASSARPELVAMVYVPPADGKKIRAGLAAQIAPTTIKREEYGFIRGVVRSVAQVPSTSEGMMRTLKNQQLVKSLSGGGAPFEVVVELERTSETPSGFRWSSSRGPDAEFNGGTMAEATITIRRVHLISLAIPALGALLDR
jgi:HlyD family secretion protein